MVWTDASDIGLAAVVEIGGAVVEGRSRLRPPSDKRHINVVELEAAIRGLSLAEHWKCKSVLLKTDSKTVASRDAIGNVRCVRTKGLYDTLVQRRLQIVTDLIHTTCMAVSVEWVPSKENPADALTRVPNVWIQHGKSLAQKEMVAVAARLVIGPVSMEKMLRPSLPTRRFKQSSLR